MERVGWKRDLPDFRDYTPNHPPVRADFDSLQVDGAARALEHSADLSEYFPPVTTGEKYAAAAAVSCVAMAEYFQRRVNGDTERASVLFVEKAALSYSHSPGRCELDLRTTFKAMVQFGLPPARLFPLRRKSLWRDPPPFAFGFGDRLSQLRYVRIAGAEQHGTAVLERVKACLAAGFPVVCGFAEPGSLTSDPEVPFRPAYDRVGSGVAVVAVGYEDRRIGATVGALRIRGCWGPTWGDSGYGWLPYAYVQHNLAVDFWTIYSPPWLQSGELGQPFGEAALH